MKISVLPIVFTFTLLIACVIFGFRFTGGDGHSDFSIEDVSPYLPGQEFQTAHCDTLTVLGQYYDNGDSYYYCVVNIDKGGVKYVDLIMDAYQVIHYTYFSLYKDKVELDDILIIWPGKMYKHYKFRLYGYIIYDNVHITVKLHDNGIGYGITSVVIYTYKETLKNV